MSPLSIPNPAVKNKKLRITVPCGKCAACLQNKRNDWATRLRIEANHQKTAYFITLTYSNEFLKISRVLNKDGKLLYSIPTLCKKDVQKFMKRLRKSLEEVVNGQIYRPELKYYLVGEYGSKTYRPHYHIILFGVEKTGVRLEKLLYDAWSMKSPLDGEKKMIGMVDIGTVTPASIKYVTNYVVQKYQYQNPFIESPFSLMSKGIGKIYIEKNKKMHHLNLSRNYIVFEDGQRSTLPRYLKEKLYCENTREMQQEHMEYVTDNEFFKNLEDHYKKNPNKNFFEYEYEQFESFKKSVESKLKGNSKI